MSKSRISGCRSICWGFVFFLIAILILHSSFFTLHLSCFTVLYCLLQFLIFVMDKLLRTLFTNAESVVQTIALIFFLPFSRMMVDILQPTVLAALLSSRRAHPLDNIYLMPYTYYIMCRLFVHGRRGAVALSILLLLIPKFFRVFLFRHIVKITVIAHYPTRP